MEQNLFLCSLKRIGFFNTKVGIFAKFNYQSLIYFLNWFGKMTMICLTVL